MLFRSGIAHGPATLFMHTGSINLVRPSVGAWVLYGLGSESDNLPGFVVLSSGNGQVILCERGIRTFETAVRNTLDLGAVALAKRESHLPVIVDPSQAAGRSDLVIALSRASAAIGADGLLVEVHPRPAEAKSDGQQQLDLAGIARLAEEIAPLVKAVGRNG